jgi:hypothetical protein
MHSVRLIIRDQEWEVVLTDKKELQISLIEIKESKVDPLWYDWEKDPIERFTIYHVEDQILPKGLCSAMVVRQLMKKVASLIQQQEIDFFYFSPSTTRKAKFYTVIVEQFLAELGKNWKHQIIDETWFYFTKHNSNK